MSEEKAKGMTPTATPIAVPSRNPLITLWQSFIKSDPPCLLCGVRPAAVVSLYYSTSAADNLMIGAPPGKTRYVFYALCQAHQPVEGEDNKSLLAKIDIALIADAPKTVVM